MSPYAGLLSCRLWVRARQKKKKNADYQEFNYQDIVPETDEKGDFDNLDRMIRRANVLMMKKEIQGKVICIETISYEAATDWSIDTEATCSAFSTKKLFILRIFYEEGRPLNQELGKYIQTTFVIVREFTAYNDAKWQRYIVGN